MKLVCRQCGTHYEKGKFCLECGSPLEEVQVQKVLYCANCQMVVESGKFCPECGARYTSYVTYCHYDGTELIERKK